MSTPKQEKSLARRDALTLTAGQSVIELEPDQLRAVVGGAKPKVEVIVKPDGTIVIKVS